MILYPAIDLKDGQCVRVVHGDFATATVFNDNPANQAEQFAKAGFDWLHVIDLNGSAEGRPVNAAAVEAILEAVSLPVQLGGGIRSLERIEAWIEAGVSRVILGTVAVRDPALVKAAAKQWPEQIAVSVDVRKGQVAVQGWLENTGLDALTVARRFEDAGVSTLIITDIDRDGSLTGFNVDVFGAVADAVSIPVIAAGGLTTAADILALRARKGVPISGAVLGRAIYAGTITAKDAIAAARSPVPAGAV
ncbi:MAG TPA: 1-(5-phosphoribosyl)-5-[(5-phosphoribosylamino)methylideneamino]imidazole-4-carboxamide isomerase [Caulobacteraceae bacterium]|nr:1-(5-phosphoribosyl)-5-[(5-phosphoribosylamino)methylideneamino]imidazole-4-carboxamide isomerase [Caulobacteraceae bacterium]